jgi:hypothetical protein
VTIGDTQNLRSLLHQIVCRADDKGVRVKVKTLGSGVANLVLLLTLLVGTSPARADYQPQLPVYTTDHYILHTDVSPDLARDLGERLDAMYDEYARRLGAFGRDNDRALNVWVFQRKIDYMKFIDDRLPNTGGVFIPNKNCLAAYLETQGRDALRRTLQHEAFHQFAHRLISPELPVWINEGIAQLFEEGIYTGKRFIVEQVPPRRLRQLQDDMSNRRLTAFQDFVFMDHREWASNMRDRDRGSSQYNQAWAMVHFLVYAEDANTGTPLYRERFFQMLTQVKNGVDPKEAFRANFGVNFAGFQERFLAYARSLTATPESNFVENAEVLSDLMVEIHNSEKRVFRSVPDFRTHLERGGYQLKYTKGQLRWTTSADVDIYFKDLRGRDLDANQCGLVSNPNAPLPDLVLRPGGNLEYRARFYIAEDGKPDREIIVRSY